MSDPVNTPPTTSPVATGHPIGFWFFFWGEFAERCSYYGMRAILALYMTEKLGVDKADAGTYMSLFIAACYFFPLIGGWIADNFFGKYWTIVLFSAPYVIGQFLVGFENTYVVFGALTLLAMGSGVIKPNISTLMGITYEQQRFGQDQLRTDAFNYFYMAINIGAAISQFAMPLLRVNNGYKVAFLFPALFMTLALIVFALGKRFYGHETITRKVVTPQGTQPADTKTLTGIPVKYVAITESEKAEEGRLRKQTLVSIGALFLTAMFFWAIFDQSASTWIFFADTYMTKSIFGIPLTADQVQSFNAIFIVIMVPINVAFFKWLAGKDINIKPTQKMLVGFALTAISMFIMAFAGSMAEKKQTVLKVVSPEGMLMIPNVQKPLEEYTDTSATIGDQVSITATDWEYLKDKKKLQFKNGSIQFGEKILTVQNGHLVGADISTDTLKQAGVLEPLLKTGNSLSSVSAEPGEVTVETADWTPPETRVPVLWQVFAYFIITLAEILISVVGLELAFVAAPKSMRSFVTACWLAIVGCANLFINAPITRLYADSNPAIYFLGLGIAMALVMIVFLPIAKKFNKTMAEKQPD